MAAATAPPSTATDAPRSRVGCIPGDGNHSLASVVPGCLEASTPTQGGVRLQRWMLLGRGGRPPGEWRRWRRWSGRRGGAPPRVVSGAERHLRGRCSACGCPGCGGGDDAAGGGGVWRGAWSPRPLQWRGWNHNGLGGEDVRSAALISARRRAGDLPVAAFWDRRQHEDRRGRRPGESVRN